MTVFCLDICTGYVGLIVLRPLTSTQLVFAMFLHDYSALQQIMRP